MLCFNSAFYSTERSRAVMISAKSIHILKNYWVFIRMRLFCIGLMLAFAGIGVYAQKSQWRDPTVMAFTYRNKPAEIVVCIRPSTSWSAEGLGTGQGVAVTTDKVFCYRYSGYVERRRISFCVQPSGEITMEEKLRKRTGAGIFPGAALLQQLTIWFEKWKWRCLLSQNKWWRKCGVSISSRIYRPTLCSLDSPNRCLLKATNCIARGGKTNNVVALEIGLPATKRWAQRRLQRQHTARLFLSIIMGIRICKSDFHLYYWAWCQFRWNVLADSPVSGQ